MGPDRLKILVIEDNATDAMLLRELLKRIPPLQISLEWADRVATGRQKLENSTFDLIFLDLSLPDSEGISTVGQIRALAPQVAIVVLSGYADDVLIGQALRMGAQDYL